MNIGGAREEVRAEDARAIWDMWPEDLRSGARSGAFILWDEDERGYRCLPVLLRPVR